MVMFYDDEEKQEKKPQGKRRKWLRRAIITLLVFAGLFGTGLFILSTMGGSDESLKRAAAGFVKVKTGYELGVDKLHYVGFFPEMRVDMEGLSFRSAGNEVASIKSLDFRMGFWDLFFSKQRYRALSVADLQAGAGVFSERALVIERFALQKQASGDRPGLLAEGKYGADPFHLVLETGFSEDEKGQEVYYLAEENPFSLKAGSIEIDGKYTQGLLGTQFTIDRAGAPDTVLTGVIEARRNMLGEGLEANLEFGSSTLSLNLDFDRRRVRGTAHFGVLDLKDVQPALLFMESVQAYFPGSGQISFSGMDYAIDVTIDKLAAGGITLGHISAPVVIADHVQEISPLQGMISGGSLSGHIRLDAKTLPARLLLTAAIRNWDYGEIQQGLLGKADINGLADFNIKLAGKGHTYDELMRSLNGEAVFVGGEGKLASKAINRWGAGLINAMLPSLDPESELSVNCAIADFKIENSVARPDPLFLDTKRVTVVGDGKIDFPQNRIKLQFDPKSKNTALLDVATSVTMSGALGSPTVAPETFSLFSKIGGLALGTLNPAFLAFSMTDLGLTEKHPCHQYINVPEEDKKPVKAPATADQDDRQAGGSGRDKETAPPPAPETE